MDKKIKNYAVESLVILFSIILSFYIEGRRDLAEKNSNKNKLITDLINTIDEDLKQLDYIKSEMNRSSKIINEIQGDISSRKNILTEKQIIDKLTETNVSYSYFAQKGIFNQLIATGSFELIEKQELKLLLLKIYNHQIIIRPICKKNLRHPKKYLTSINKQINLEWEENYPQIAMRAHIKKECNKEKIFKAKDYKLEKQKKDY